jgi:hypothetical protein
MATGSLGKCAKVTQRGVFARALRMPLSLPARTHRSGKAAGLSCRLGRDGFGKVKREAPARLGQAGLRQRLMERGLILQKQAQRRGFARCKFHRDTAVVGLREMNRYVPKLGWGKGEREALCPIAVRSERDQRLS